MHKAIGFIVVLWALSYFFSSAFSAFDSAATETFKAVEMAAQVSQTQLSNAE